MNKKRALKVLEMFLDKQCSIERTLNHMDTTDVEIWDAVYTAREALSEGPCEDAISFPKGTLKKRGKGYVVYDPEWLKENWQIELKVMGVECEDAISRADTIEWLKRVTVTDGITFETGFKQILTDIQNMPSVTPKPKMGHWEWVQYDSNPNIGNWHCSECRGIVIERVNRKEELGVLKFKYCPNCGAKMSENPTGSSCTDCVLDGTDACSRGAGRAVDGRVCEDFVGESEEEIGPDKKG